MYVWMYIKKPCSMCWVSWDKFGVRVLGWYWARFGGWRWFGVLQSGSRGALWGLELVLQFPERLAIWEFPTVRATYLNPKY